jgi:hypothetical protein
MKRKGTSVIAKDNFIFVSTNESEKNQIKMTFVEHEFVVIGEFAADGSDLFSLRKLRRNSPVKKSSHSECIDVNYTKNG